MNRVKRKLIQLKEHYGNSQLMTSTFECSSEPQHENTDTNNDSHLYSQDIELVSSKDKEEDIYMHTQKPLPQKDLGIMTHHGYRQRRGNNTVKHSRVSSMQYDDENQDLDNAWSRMGGRITRASEVHFNKNLEKEREKMELWRSQQA